MRIMIASVRRGRSPRYALISVGRHNMFGHPAASTIETLRAAGAAIYRTDADGAVSLTTDGVHIKVANWFAARTAASDP